MLLSIRGSNASRAGSDPPLFVDDTPASGIDHQYKGGFTHFVGGGVAALDCDGDRMTDLFLAGGEGPSHLYRNESEIGGRLRFEAVALPVPGLSGVIGAYPIDVDGDEVTDLAVLRVGENVMLRGLGGCRFERANELWGIDGGAEWTTGFSATWPDGGALPTLAFGNYINLSQDGDRADGCADNAVVRPGPDGYRPVERLSPGWCSLSILFSDWDRAGRSDLRISNDRQYYRDGAEQLWSITLDGPPRLYTEQEGWRLLRINGMGIASHDLTGDGRPEVYLTSMGDNKLQTLATGATGPVYEDIALVLGATAHRPFTGEDVAPSTAWHAEFDDVNNDGLIDLYVTKGNVDSMEEFAADDPNNLMLGQADGTFIEAAGAAGVASISKSRGAAVVDLNLDGMLDIVEMNRSDPVRLWRSVGWGNADRPRQMGRWLAVELSQAGANTAAIGAWVELEVDNRVLWYEATIGGGHAGGQSGWIHFGLGTAERARVRVHWPGGETSRWMDVESDRFFILERGSDEPDRWVPES